MKNLLALVLAAAASACAQPSSTPNLETAHQGSTPDPEAERAMKQKAIQDDLAALDPLQRQPDISLARRTLSWEPRVPLAQGLVKTIAYFRSLDLAAFRRPTDHTAHKSSQ